MINEVHAGVDGVARRPARRRLIEMVCKTHATRRQRVQVGRLDEWMAVASERIMSELIGRDEEQIWRRRSCWHRASSPTFAQRTRAGGYARREILRLLAISADY